MWGILTSTPWRGFISRFIPTHVGNTFLEIMLHRGLSVHPHTCGEYIVRHAIPVFVGGSSPHMWGILGLDACERGLGRFIPTHVGNTSSPFTICVMSPVHPHTCGEYFGKVWRVDWRVGSSPHMWGILVTKRINHLLSRFIPTHVGNTADIFISPIC